VDEFTGRRIFVVPPFFAINQISKKSLQQNTLESDATLFEDVVNLVDVENAAVHQDLEEHAVLVAVHF
jgi:hypothetical protein